MGHLEKMNKTIECKVEKLTVSTVAVFACTTKKDHKKPLCDSYSMNPNFGLSKCKPIKC